MSKLRWFVLAVLVAALVSFAALGAGWKWSHHDAGYGPEKLAGWTWDAGVVAQPQGNGNGNGGDPNP